MFHSEHRYDLLDGAKRIVMPSKGVEWTVMGLLGSNTKPGLNHALY
jgi:hypothetical protein